MNLIVIGGGPAGEAAAKAAAKAAAGKAQVLLVEKDRVGGLCLNRGCIPSKTLLSFGKKLSSLRRAPGLFASEPALSPGAWKAMRAKKDDVVRQLRSGLEKGFQLRKIRVLAGAAAFTAPNEVSVAGADGPRAERFDKAVIACGSEPVFPPPFDRFRADLLDSDRVFELEAVPESLLIVGGGAVGCEFACLFHELGCQVTLLERMPGLLPGEDEQVVNALRQSFSNRGIRVLTGTTARSIERARQGWTASLQDGTALSAAQILVCAGRRPSLGALGLEKADVRFSPTGIDVDPRLRTSNPDVYACGDATGLSLLAHAGTAQGEVAARNALGGNEPYDGSLVPRCLYTWPEVASVGLWSAQAQAQGLEVKSHRFFFRGSGRALAEDDAEGFIQIVAGKDTGAVLGAQIIGPHATEVIHVLSVAIRKRMTTSELKEVVFAHPSYAEGIRWALER